MFRPFLRRSARPRRFVGALSAFLAAAIWCAPAAGSTPSTQAEVGAGVEAKLEAAYRRHRHVRYVFGGCDRRSMDCSCFVQQTFDDAFDLEIPRSTLLQDRFLRADLVPGLDSARQLQPGRLCPGDLLYTYRGDAWETAARHVSIYYGQGRILHASRGLGVVIQDLRVLSHHRLRGVARLFECRRPARLGPRPRLASRPGTPLEQRSLRSTVDRFFAAWTARNRSEFGAFWTADALQWRKSLRGDGTSEFSSWRQTFAELAGRPWIYSVRRLQVRDRAGFVEVATERPCFSAPGGRCDATVQTFVWRLEQGRWRIVQHELGTAQ